MNRNDLVDLDIEELGVASDETLGGIPPYPEADGVNFLPDSGISAE